MFGDLDWPLNTSRGFVRISRASCIVSSDDIRQLGVSDIAFYLNGVFTLRVSEAAAQCIVIGPVCVFVCLWVCYHDNCTCIDPHQTGFVSKGSDRLQLIKFWPPRAPGKGVCGGVKIFGSASAQCLRLL